MFSRKRKKTSSSRSKKLNPESLHNLLDLSPSRSREPKSFSTEKYEIPVSKNAEKRQRKSSLSSNTSSIPKTLKQEDRDDDDDDDEDDEGLTLSSLKKKQRILKMETEIEIVGSGGDMRDEEYRGFEEQEEEEEPEDDEINGEFM